MFQLVKGVLFAKWIRNGSILLIVVVWDEKV